MNNKNLKINLRVQQAVTALLLVAVIGLLGWLSSQYKKEFDWTAGHRNSLTTASIKQLANMKGPVQVLAFAPTGADSRAEIAQFFNRYELAKKNFTVEFIDPIKNPAKVKDFNISAAGDMVVNYDARHEVVRFGDMNEANITQALQRLSYAQERFVVFLTGHGEHGLEDRGAGGYSSLSQILKDNGLKAQSQNLASIPRLPDNAGALVVAGPTTALQEGETKILLDYLAEGGHLLWLSDPDSPPPSDALVKALGVSFEKGTAVFPEYAQLSGDPSMFITMNYPSTPVTQDLTENTIFPLVTSISADTAAKPEPAWKSQPFLQSTQNAWLETGPLSGEIGFEPEMGDKPGPLTLGLLLTRSVKAAAAETKPAAAAAAAQPAKTHEQRAALVGDSDWLSNSLLGQAGNTKLGLNLLRWLVSRDEQLGITVPEAPDSSLDLSPGMTATIVWGFLLILPLGLLAIGVARWVIRRRR